MHPKLIFRTNSENPIRFREDLTGFPNSFSLAPARRSTRGAVSVIVVRELYFGLDGKTAAKHDRSIFEAPHWLLTTKKGAEKRNMGYESN